MDRIKLALLAFLAASCVWGAAAAADLAAFGKLPAIEEVAISPNGKLLASIRTDGENRRISVLNLADQKTLGLVNAGRVKVREIFWVDDDNVVVLATDATDRSTSDSFSNAQSERETAILFTVSTKTQKPLIGGKIRNMQDWIYGDPMVRILDGKPKVVVPGAVNGDLVLINVEVPTGATEVNPKTRRDAYQYAVSADGEILAANLERRTPTEYRLLVKGTSGLEPAVLPKDMTEGLSLVGLSADGVWPIVTYRVDNHWKFAEIHGAADWRPLDIPEEAEVVDDPQSGRMLAIRHLDGDHLTFRFADPADQKVWDNILTVMGDRQVDYKGVSADHKHWLVLGDSKTDGPAYFLVDLTNGTVVLLGHQYAGIDGGLGAKRALTYQAADGKTITGYLTTPPNAASAKGLPLVVLVHGGPAVRDEPGFDWWAQGLAAEGYAVLQVNYRGSGGLGVDFMESGYGEWGKKMQTDVSDGVRYLAAQGVIDPKRVCIVGGSYGGYAALAGATLDAGVYRCAASIAGPSDLERMLELESPAAQKYWMRFMGVTRPNSRDLDKISPIKHVDAITVPILLIHGKDDVVVNYNQSVVMATALRWAKKPYEFITLDGEDHWLSRGATRLKMLESVVAFLKKNNPPN